MARNLFIAALPQVATQDKIKEKIEESIQYLKLPLRIEWGFARDFHVTLGYIRDIDDSDVIKIAQGFGIIKEFQASQAVVYDSKIYGTAVSLKLQPIKPFETMHKKLISALADASKGKYTFSEHKQFEAHLTIGRIRGLKRRVSHEDSKIITSWANKTFRNLTLLIDEVSIMYRSPSPTSNYQKLISFRLNV